MKNFIFFAAAALFISGCSLVSPFTITFTNTPGEVVDPAVSTLDFVVSEPTLAYVSKVECEGADPITLLPIVEDSQSTSVLHKLTLEAMIGMPAASTCEVSVTVFDPTTTETASNSITLTMFGEAEVVEEEVTEEPTTEEEPALEVELGVEAETEITTEPSTEPYEEAPVTEPTEPAGTEEQGA